MSRLRSALKRALLVFALLGLVLGALVLPGTSLAYTDGDPGIWVVMPADGVGDSPIMP